MTVAGWGKTEDGKFNAILRYANISIYNDEKCKAIYTAYKPDEMLCAGPDRNRRGSCDGDDGGPLTYNGAVVGLVSYASECGSQRYRTMYTRVSHYIDWLIETISY